MANHDTWRSIPDQQCSVEIVPLLCVLRSFYMPWKLRACLGHRCSIASCHGEELLQVLGKPWSMSVVCNAGVLLSSQTTNHEPTIRTVGLPELEMQIKSNQPLRRKSAIATAEKPQKEISILRWKNGSLFWVPYWKSNSAHCQHRKRTPKRGPFFGSQNGARLLVKL